MLKLADRVKETSITVGNGIQIALAGAFGAFQTFASTIGDGNSTYYTIENNNNFEVGVGTYNASNNTLSRDLVLSSTNNNQRISLDGVSIVFCCYPASQAVLLDNGLINSPSPNYNGIVFPSSTVIDTALLSGIVSTSILPTSIVYSNDSRLSDSRNPNPHTHPISDITALQNALDSKQPTGSYASSVHSHVVSDVQNLQSLLDGKQTAGSYAASSHSHTSSQITDFAAAVSSVAPPTTNAELLTTGILSDDRLSNNIVRTTDVRLSDARTPLSHNHNISDISGLQTSLDSKQASGSYADLSHTHDISSISGLQSALDGKQASGNYATLSHTHTASNITDFNSSVSGLISGIYATLSSPILTGVPLTPTASSGTNTNQIASTSFVRTEISNLVASSPSTLDTLNELATALGNDPNFATTITNNLASKAALSGATFTGSISSPSGSFTSLKVNNIGVSLEGHGHSISDISNLQTSLDGKASTSHIHVIADVTGLQTALDGKQASGNYAALSHSHELVDISGLQTALDSKQPSGSYANLSHTHLIADVSELQTALDGKQPSGSYVVLPSGGTANQILQKISDLSYDLEWIDNYATELSVYVKNTTGSVLTKGQAVYINGAQGDNPTITLAIASSESGSSKTLGLLRQNLDVNEFGYVVCEGILEGLDTSNANQAGDTMWLSPTISGGIIYGTNNKPSAPYHMVFIGYVIRKQSSNGKVFIKVQNGFEIEELHNVAISGLSNHQILKYDSSSSLWKNSDLLSSYIDDFNSSVSGLLSVKNIVGGLYVDVTATTGNFTVSVTGLQPSGSYAASSHNHTSSEITDFNTSVSGLLPVTTIIAGNNITVSSSSGIYTIDSSGSGSGNSILSYETVASFPATGSTNSYYLASNTSRIYQWTGSYYAEMGPPVTSINNAQNAANLYLWNNFK